MKETSPDSPSIVNRIRSWARTKAYGTASLSNTTGRNTILPLSHSTTETSTTLQNTVSLSNSNNVTIEKQPLPVPGADGSPSEYRLPQPSIPSANVPVSNTSADSPPPAPPPQVEGSGAVVTTDDPAEPKPKNVATRFYETSKDIIFSSWLNVLLIFVPVGIAVNFAPGINPTIIFAMNAIAIVPLAGLLSYATESVAQRMGDTIGALMNVTFGNAVEMIIFIALAHDEISIVQAAVLGSILSNLLLILGMCFLVGGLRFREQIYNSTVTQMSACLLSLSVMSLLLPTAFHASFNDPGKANSAVLQVSRGTSVILLLVYGLYLLFQLKSHAYMYQSTPQHIIDEESVPGPVAAWMDSSTSDDDSSSSSDSDSSGRSNTTAGRMRKLIGRRRRRRSSASRGSDPPAATRTPSYATSCASHTLDSNGAGEGSSLASHVAVRFGVTPDVHDDTDDEATHHGRSRAHSFSEKHGFRRKKDRKHRKKHHHHKHKGSDAITTTNENVPATGKMGQSLATSYNEPRRVDFAISDNTAAASDTATQKRQFSALKAISSIRPSIPQSLSQNVFTAPSPTASPAPPEEPIVTGPIPKVRYGIRRTNSLPGRLNQMNSNPGGQAPMASVVPPIANPAQVVNAVEGENIMSRTSAVLLLLISTGLVAICANFMVDSIDSVTSSTSLGPTFVGLILLPVVGNAAEHVTAVTVAAKNKMDLAIGVAVGSSIQVALFITPFIVLLAWCMGKPMTLYFTLFETVSLFVSVFVVNFLVLDGRSNYLEGSLLCCAYIIIAVAAFFYPGVDDQNQLGGAVAEPIVNMIRSVIAV